MSRKYEKHDSDEGWFPVKSRGFRLKCCDCALVHVIDFRKGKSGMIELRIERNERATSAARRKIKKKVVIVHD